MLIKLKCSVCGKDVSNEGENEGIITWDEFDSKNSPINPKAFHKKSLKGCDKYKDKYSYEINDFARDFPKIIINIK